MAQKLDNNQEYELTNVEVVWQSQQIIKSGIKDLKVYRKKSRLISFSSYTLFSGSALMSGRALASCINDLNFWNVGLFLIFTPWVFFDNFLGIYYLKQSRKHTNVINDGKATLIILKKLDDLDVVFEDDVVESLKDTAHHMKEYIKHL